MTIHALQTFCYPTGPLANQLHLIFHAVTSPLNPKIVSVAGLSAGAAALSTEERKHTENDPKCNALGWCSVPLVTESYAAWGKEAMDSFKMLASPVAAEGGGGGGGGAGGSRAPPPPPPQ